MEYIDLWCIFKGSLLPSTTSRAPKTAKEAETQKLKRSDPFLGQGDVARAISSGGFQLMLRVLRCLGVCSRHHKRHLQGKRVFSFSVKPEDGGRVWWGMRADKEVSETKDRLETPLSPKLSEKRIPPVTPTSGKIWEQNRHPPKTFCRIH